MARSSHSLRAGQVWPRRERQRLTHALRTAPSAAVYRRLTAVLLVAEGQPVSAAARVVHAARTSVQTWVRRYRDQRTADALRDQARSGRPRSAPALTRQHLLQLLQYDPRTLGYGATTWTVPLLSTALDTHSGITISPATLRRRLHQWRIHAKRPRYVYSGKAEHLPQKKGPLFAAYSDS